jgi:hypothetical protein
MERDNGMEIIQAYAAGLALIAAVWAIMEVIL